MVPPELEHLVAAGAVTIPAACEHTGLGRTFLYGLMDAGKLKYCKVGKRRLIPLAELHRLLAESIVG